MRLYFIYRIFQADTFIHHQRSTRISFVFPLAYSHTILIIILSIELNKRRGENIHNTSVCFRSFYTYQKKNIEMGMTQWKCIDACLLFRFVNILVRNPDQTQHRCCSDRFYGQTCVYASITRCGTDEIERIRTAEISFVRKSTILRLSLNVRNYRVSFDGLFVWQPQQDAIIILVMIFYKGCRR